VPSISRSKYYTFFDRLWGIGFIACLFAMLLGILSSMAFFSSVIFLYSFSIPLLIIITLMLLRLIFCGAAIRTVKSPKANIAPKQIDYSNFPRISIIRNLDTPEGEESENISIDIDIEID
jgi:hypothetical protein